MKILPIVTFALLTSLLPVAAAEFTGTIDFQSADINKQVLKLYKEGTGLELVVSSQVEHLSTPIKIRSLEPISTSELMKLIEKALLEQAGVVITRLDDKKASVTWNDHLPISAPK